MMRGWNGWSWWGSAGCLTVTCRPRLATSLSVMTSSSLIRGACRHRSPSSAWPSASRRTWPPVRTRPAGTNDHRPAPQKTKRSGNAARTEGAEGRRCCAPFPASRAPSRPDRLACGNWIRRARPRDRQERAYDAAGGAGRGRRRRGPDRA